MSGEVYGGILADELAHTVERLAGSLFILEDNAQFVGFQGCVAVGHVAVEHIVETVVFGNDDAVALGVALGLDKPNARSYLLGVGEVLIRLAILSAHNVVAFQFHGVGILGCYIYFCIRKLLDAVAVVVVLVGQQNLRHLLGFVASGCEGFHVIG